MLNLQKRKTGFKKKINFGYRKDKRMKIGQELSKKKKEKRLMQKRNLKLKSKEDNSMESLILDRLNEININDIQSNFPFLIDSRDSINSKWFESLFSLENPIEMLVNSFENGDQIQQLQAGLIISIGTGKYLNNENQNENQNQNQNQIQNQTKFINSLEETQICAVSINQLNNSDEMIQQSAITILGNLAQEKITFRDQIIELGFIEAIKNMESARIELAHECIWALSRCFINKTYNFQNISNLQSVISLFCGSLLYDDTQIIQDSAMALVYLSDTSETIQFILNENILNRLFELIIHPDSEIQIPILRLLANISVGEQDQIQTLININIHEILVQLLENNLQQIRQISCCILANIVGINSEIVDFLFQSNAFDFIYQIIEKDDPHVQIEAIPIVINSILTGTNDQEKLQNKIIFDFFEIIFSIKDSGIALNLLFALEKIFEIDPNNILLSKPHFIDFLNNFLEFNDIEVARKIRELKMNFVEKNMNLEK
ncbi:importin alpha [Anaeramoeba ignava]|uniref:Importin alpha n=1 Tax=Anaeramoeba ignava TaxID=1746090 RepID=A0A9Q0L6F9_ANAIG|nr:importin alpha [Anaeramoeba ignava]